eukprot:NODE_410_length_863_cov_412.972826_g401_i0.p1 GENE.NODE_410_length_863_cov_412.972826_g401_i0~~NODE_410_length_863_cov_412.972826_g401_i0.p1  ORF type:complete len:254 (-),score=33.63 NODE_410_length_863_cov_412.972826_g401_i0:101-802(-)
MQLLDPTTLFVLGCLLTPAVLNYNDTDALKEYFTDPHLLLCTLLTLLLIFITHCTGKTVKLSARDKRAATWFLLNGTYIHILMDGLVGAYHKLPLMDKSYLIVDKRFTRGWSDERGTSIVMISLIELFVMGPLCCLVYYGYYKNKGWRRPLEVIVSTLQFMGAVMFTGPELLNGMVNIPTDWKLEFTQHHLVYFWFAFVFCEPLWMVVPAMFIYRAVKDISNLYDRHNLYKSL